MISTKLIHPIFTEERNNACIHRFSVSFFVLQQKPQFTAVIYHFSSAIAHRFLVNVSTNTKAPTKPTRPQIGRWKSKIKLIKGLELINFNGRIHKHAYTNARHQPLTDKRVADQKENPAGISQRESKYYPRRPGFSLGENGVFRRAQRFRSLVFVTFA